MCLAVNELKGWLSTPTNELIQRSVRRYRCHDLIAFCGSFRDTYRPAIDLNTSTKLLGSSNYQHCAAFIHLVIFGWVGWVFDFSGIITNRIKKNTPKPGFKKELNDEFNLDDCNLDLKAPFIRLSLLYL